jgi:succinylglutamic semialdehyde dehydrogenase
MKGKGHFINNEWNQGTGPEFQSTDPATGDVNWIGRIGTEEEVDRAVHSAIKAFGIWSAVPVKDRVQYLEAFEEQLTEHKINLAETISRETGKPKWEALTEVTSMIAKIKISVEAYYDRCATRIGELSGAATAVRFKPHGVVAVFGPFNLPGHLPNGHIVPALLAGNSR